MSEEPNPYQHVTKDGKLRELVLSEQEFSDLIQYSREKQVNKDNSALADSEPKDASRAELNVKDLRISGQGGLKVEFDANVMND